MATYIRKAFLVLAGIILLLHTLLPHEHPTCLHNESQALHPKGVAAVLSVIRLACLIDLGEGHLEQYQASEKMPCLADVVLLEDRGVLFTPLQQQFPRLSTPESCCLPSSSLFSSQIRFRGPPQSA